MRKAIILIVFILVSACAHAPSEIRTAPILTVPEKIEVKINSFDVAEIINFALARSYHDIDHEKCLTELRNGEVEACLGKLSKYFASKQFKKYAHTMKGITYAGTGLFYKIQNGTVVVNDFLPNSSAAKAGVKLGDRLLGTREDGEETFFAGFDHEDIYYTLRGDINSSYTLLIKRGDNYLEVYVTRSMFSLKRVVSPVISLPATIGYLRPTTWNGGIAAIFKEISDDYLRAGAKKFIFDVRNNPGGLLEEPLSALTLYEADENAPLVTVRGRYPKEQIFTRASLRKSTWSVYQPILKDAPCVVLINRATASSSEIFAANLKLRGCYVIGENSFGKGTVQTIVTLSSGAGFRLTTDEYFVGLSIKIDGIGVSPNMLIRNPTGWQIDDAANDYQLRAAIDYLNSK